MVEDVKQASNWDMERKMSEELKLSMEAPFKVEQLQLDKPGSNLSAIISMINPALETHTTPGAKKQKMSYLRSWGSFCATYNINIDTFGEMAKEVGLDSARRAENIWKEVQFLSGFAIYVVFFQEGKPTNITRQRTLNEELA